MNSYSIFLMQIESLKVFCDLTETESFTRAAQINQITQSAVSQQVSALERQFNTLLIERSKKRFRLTQEGQILYDAAKNIVQIYDTMCSRLQELKGVIAGTVRVSTIYSIGLHSLPPYLTRYLKTYPNVNVHVEYRRPEQVYEDVLANAVDMGLVACPTRDPRLDIIPWNREQMVIICHPEHPLAKNKRTKLAAIDGQKFIAFEAGVPTRRAIDRVLRERRVNVRIIMELDNVETVKRAVEIDAGIAIVPLNTVTQEIAKQTIAAIEVEDAELQRACAIIVKKNKVLSNPARLFISVLKEN
ncbi:MAG: LysR family transcriptional regulator [Verrucomicrobiae bacterium]|nr:LysR family transcriptional regulator [Verrucomicrobiae bacterium]